MPRLLLALPLAALLFAAAPSPALADSAGAHASAARKAQKAHNWSKALEEWQAAYRIEPNADYLIGMGDAYAKLGDKANAKKQYEAYMADPLALDGDSVKAKIAALDKKQDDGLSLDLGGGDLDLPGAAAPAADKGKKGKKGKAAAADLSLDLGGGLDLPATPPAKKDTKVASSDLSLDLGPAPAPAKPAAKVASSDLSLDLGPAPAPAKPAPAKPATPATKPADALALDAMATPPAKPAATTAAKVAVTTPPPSHPAPAAATPPPPAKAAPAVAVTTAPEPKVVEHNNRIIAYATGGLAVGALAVGGLYYTKASQDHSDLSSNTIRSGAAQQSLISDEKTNKSLSFACLATGLVLAGVTAALFAF